MAREEGQCLASAVGRLNAMERLNLPRSLYVLKRPNVIRRLLESPTEKREKRDYKVKPRPGCRRTICGEPGVRHCAISAPPVGQNKHDDHRTRFSPGLVAAAQRCRNCHELARHNREVLLGNVF